MNVPRILARMVHTAEILSTASPAVVPLDLSAHCVRKVSLLFLEDPFTPCNKLSDRKLVFMSQNHISPLAV